MASVKRPLLKSGEDYEEGDIQVPATPTVAPLKSDDPRRQRLLIICFCLMLVIGLGNRVTSIVQYDYLNYPLFVNMLTTFAYLPTSLLYVIPMQIYRPDIITPEARAVPHRVWFIMGALDSIAGIMQSLALSYIDSGALITLLLQSAIPISMVITRIFLKTKYSAAQIIGALIVITGLICALLPRFIGGDKSSDDAKTTAIWSGVLVLSCVPMTLSSVYKEKALGDTEIDAIYLNYWVAFYQFLLSFPLLVPSGYASNVPAQDLPSNMYDGMMCYFGRNMRDGDNCSLAPLFSNLYILFNLAYNVLIILMLKYGSSNILWLCLTMQVPIANLTFAIPFMPKSEPAQWESALALILIMLGLITYRFWPQVHVLLVKYGFSEDKKPEPQDAYVSEAELMLSEGGGDPNNTK